MFSNQIDTRKYKRITIDQLNNQGCLNVLEAFLKELREEFVSTYKDYIKYPNDKKYAECYKHIRDYILSDDFAYLTGLKGSDIIDALEKSVFSNSKWTNYKGGYVNGKILFA